MFETLDSQEQPVARWYPLLLYSTYGVAGLAFLIEGVLRHHPLGLITGLLMFLLSSIWLISVIKSPGTVDRRGLRLRRIVLLSLPILYEIAYTVASRWRYQGERWRYLANYPRPNQYSSAWQSHGSEPHPTRWTSRV